MVMPRHHEPPEGLGDLLRRARVGRRLSLRQVSNEIEKRGEWLPPSTLSRIERGKLDPSVRRLFLLLDLYHLEAMEVADLVRRTGPPRSNGSGSAPISAPPLKAT